MYNVIIGLMIIMIGLEVLIFWIDYGKGIREMIVKDIEYLKMKKDMKKIESKSYYTIDDVLEVRMNFNKKFWGNKGFICPRIIKRYIGKYFYDYIIRFE